MYIYYRLLALDLDFQFVLSDLDDEVSALEVGCDWHIDVHITDRLPPFVREFGLLFLFSFAIFFVLALALRGSWRGRHDRMVGLVEVGGLEGTVSRSAASA